MMFRLSTFWPKRYSLINYKINTSSRNQLTSHRHVYARMSAFVSSCTEDMSVLIYLNDVAIWVFIWTSTVSLDACSSSLNICRESVKCVASMVSVALSIIFGLPTVNDVFKSKCLSLFPCMSFFLMSEVLLLGDLYSGCVPFDQLLKIQVSMLGSYFVRASLFYYLLHQVETGSPPVLNFNLTLLTCRMVNF